MDGSNFYAEVGGNIKTYRKLQHMTQQELAGKINKSMACISKYEKGDISIDLYTLYEIAEVLNIPPALLLPQDTGASRLPTRYRFSALSPALSAVSLHLVHQAVGVSHQCADDPARNPKGDGLLRRLRSVPLSGQ